MKANVDKGHDLSAAFQVWPPPLVGEVDPFDFGVATGADRPMGRSLNHYVPRDIDTQIFSRLSTTNAVVVVAPAGAGVVRTIYEALNTCLPDAAILIPAVGRAIDPAVLHSVPATGKTVLWIDDLTRHWLDSGPDLIVGLRQWLDRPGHSLVATCYQGHDEVLRDRRFEHLRIPVLTLSSTLSTGELERMEEIYGSVTTRHFIGANPPSRSMRADPMEGFSRSVTRAARSLGPDRPVAASAFADEIRTGHATYGGRRLKGVELHPDRGTTRPVRDWLVDAVACYDVAEVRASRHQVIDGRLMILALAVLDPDLERQLGEEMINKLNQECEVHPVRSTRPAREHVDLQTDDVVGLAEDGLGRRGVAEALTVALRRHVERNPGRSFMVHIDGAWGAGKSTLLGFVRQQLDDPPAAAAYGPGRPAAGDWLIIPFDAWRQAKSGLPWLTLLQSIRAGVRRTQRGPWARMTFWMQERARLVAGWQWFALAFVSIAVAAVVWWLSGIADPAAVGWTEWVKLAGTLLPLLAAGWLVAGSAGRFLLLNSKRSAQAFLDTRADPMEDLSAHFDWLMVKANRPVVVMIDDLDRCPQAYVVDLLDAVQKMMRDRQPGLRGDETSSRSLVVIVAADGRWIRQSFDNTFAGMANAVDAPGVTVGSLYLEKMFQLTVPVPRLSEELKAAYLGDLLRDPGDRFGGRRTGDSGADLVRRIEESSPREVLSVLAQAPALDRIKASEAAIRRLVIDSDAQTSTRHALEAFASLLDTTPRAMKRFVMAYSMIRAVRTAEGCVVGVGPLALWTILLTRWPVLGEYLQNSPEAVNLFARPRDDLPPNTPNDLRIIFSDPPTALREVMNHPSGPLSTDMIRECSGQGRSAVRTG